MKISLIHIMVYFVAVLGLVSLALYSIIYIPLALIFVVKNTRYLYLISYGIDQLSNIILSPVFNKTLVKKEGYKFGNPDETISGVLGKNTIKQSCTKLGALLVYLLNKVDKNHVYKAIEKDENNI